MPSAVPASPDAKRRIAIALGASVRNSDDPPTAAHLHSRCQVLRYLIADECWDVGVQIDIVVDNVVAGYHPLFFAFRVFREHLVADVLFRELGHHLDATIGAAAPSGEAAAEDWSRRLARSYFQRRYWWLRPIAKVLLPTCPLDAQAAVSRKPLTSSLNCKIA